jgi:hypothetical protein
MHVLLLELLGLFIWVLLRYMRFFIVPQQVVQIRQH